MIPFYSFQYQHQKIETELLKVFAETYRSNWYILGEKLKQFESDFSNYSGTKYTLGVGNGLDALKISLKALDIKPGDEVIVPANTYIATWLAVSELGAIAVPIEPELETYNINPNLIEEKITHKTKAIIPVHLYGMPCKMDEILAIAKKFNLPIVEDNAQAVGASYKERKTGTFGILNATSFYPTKNLGALGDGGAITTSNEALAKKVSLLRNYGSEIKYHNEIEGYNSRLDEIQAAVLSLKLNYLDEWNKERVRQAQRYNHAFKAISKIGIPIELEGFYNVFHLYVIRIKERDKLMKYLDNKSIQTMIHYPIPPYRQNAYHKLQYDARNFPITERLTSECLSLPLYPGLTDEEQNTIIQEIINFCKK